MACQDVKPDTPSHTKGTHRGEEWVRQRPEPGREGTTATARSSTSINPKKHGPIDPPMPRVRVWPHKQADILDMEIEGKTAVVEAIEQDLEGNVQLAVTIDDDPGRDLGMLRQIGHRFFYSPEEVEPLQMENP